LLIAAMGCSATEQASDPPAPIWALDGRPHLPPELTAARWAQLEAELREARHAFDRDPENLEAILWLGRRTAYLGRFEEAIEIFTRGLVLHPDDPRLLRHRGHRWITVRRFDRAIEDLERAVRRVAGQPDRVEPDGQPNARN
jgi:tetratricopeptide (TPR) repeat protein